MWRVLDAAAHVLYCPTMLGRRAARARWYHRIHLIPGALLGWVCDHYDVALGMTWDEVRASRGEAAQDGIFGWRWWVLESTRHRDRHGITAS